MRIDTLIENIVRKNLNEMTLRNNVRRLVSEEIYGRLNILNEDSDDLKRRNVMNMLRDNKYDHAQLAYYLWKPKDEAEKDTLRSKFSKCARGVLNFSDKEISKLYSYMRKR